MASHRVILLCVAVLAASVSAARDRAPGSAVVTVDENEYLIPIECYEAANASAGFSTEPNRITREQTGRSSMVRLTARPWKETEYWVISLDRYMAWIPAPTRAGPTLEMTVDLSPSSTINNGIPETLTFEKWMDGMRPEGLTGVTFVANCAERNPDAPAYRKLPVSE